jgi:hypothetical protein
MSQNRNSGTAVFGNHLFKVGISKEKLGRVGRRGIRGARVG